MEKDLTIETKEKDWKAGKDSKKMNEKIKKEDGHILRDIMFWPLNP